MPAKDVVRTLAPLLAAAAIGCSSNNSAPTVPSPFESADKVPPPALRSVPGAAQPYYTPSSPAYAPGGAAPSTFAPGQTTPSGYPAAPAGTAPAWGAPPAQTTPAPTALPGQATPVYGPMGSTTAPSTRQVAGGDVVSVPTDAASVRFNGVASQSATSQQFAATTTPTRREATANAWIAGSAPVRSTPEAAPRVRVPGTVSEPVSLAAIQGVPIAPLEPAPTGAAAGEPAALRVASPDEATLWR